LPGGNKIYPQGISGYFLNPVFNQAHKPSAQTEKKTRPQKVPVLADPPAGASSGVSASFRRYRHARTFKAYLCSTIRHCGN